MYSKTIVVLMICATVSLCQQDMAESMRVQALEKEITQAVQMKFDNYKLYPFAISV